MNKTTSQTKMPTYQVSGNELSIFWDEQTEVRDDETVYVYSYCVLSVFADRSQIIESIIQCSYPTYGAELAAIINGGEDAAQHEQARAQAKILADGWPVNA